MALKIGLLGSSALQNDGRAAPVILQCRTPRETNPKGHWGPNHSLINSWCLLPPCTHSWYTQSYDLQNIGQGHATTLANAADDALASVILQIVSAVGVNLDVTAEAFELLVSIGARG